MNFKTLLFKNFDTGQTIFKNTVWLGLAEIISRGLVFFLNILLIRYLSIIDYGKFGFAFAFIAIFSFGDLGISTLTIREVAKNNSLVKKYLDHFFTLKLILALFTLVLILAATQFLNKPMEIKFLIYSAAVFTALMSLMVFFQTIFQAFEKMEYIAMSKLAYSIGLLAIFVFMIWQKYPLATLFLGYIGAVIFAFAITLFLIKKKITVFSPRINFDFWKNSLRESWPFGLIDLLAGGFLSISIIQISFLAGDKEIGFYNVAYQLIAVLTILIGLFYNAFFSTLSKKYQQSKSEFYQLLRYFTPRIIIFCLALSLFLFLIAPQLILKLYGEKYSESINIARILLIAISISFINTPYFEGLKIAGQQKECLKPMFWGISVGLLLNFPLVLFLGSRGAAISLIFSSLIITVLIISRFKKFKNIDCVIEK